MDGKHRFLQPIALLVLATLVQCWVIARAVVPALDTVRYVSVSQTLLRDGLPAMLLHEPEPPLYPLLIVCVKQLSSAVGWSMNWGLAAQYAAAVPVILAVLPVWWFGRLTLNHQAAWWGSILFCLLPDVALLGAEGISDGPHLFLASAALACWARGARHDASQVWPVMAGMLTAAALMARAEALALVAAVICWGVAAMLMSFLRKNNFANYFSTRSALAFVAGLGLLLLPYLVASGATSWPRAVERLLGRRTIAETTPLNADRQQLARAARFEASSKGWYFADRKKMPFSRKDPSETTRQYGYLAGLTRTANGIAQVMYYSVAGLAAWGLWTGRALANVPLHRFLTLLALLLIAGAIQHAATHGYLASRHLLMLVPLGVHWAGHGAMDLARRLHNSPLLTRGESSTTARPLLGLPGLTAMIALCASLVSLPALARPLHASRAAHRQAAEWLAEQEDQQGTTLDSVCLTALYSNWPTYRYESAQAAFTDTRLRYVVVEAREVNAESRRGEALRQLLAIGGQPLARFGGTTPAPEDVLIFHWQTGKFAPEQHYYKTVTARLNTDPRK